MLLPQRVESHILEEASERFFLQNLPESWVSEKPKHDYGIDFKIDIFEDNKATGLELLVQLKASKSTGKSKCKIRLDVSTYNYLWGKLQVVMLIKYVYPLKKAYWILLKDVPAPQPGNKTFTITIPEENDFATIDWQKLHEYVKSVTDRKIAAQRAHFFLKYDCNAK